MRFLNFDMVKNHLRLDDEQAQLEHELVCSYAAAAENAVLNVCNRDMEDFVEQYGEVPAGIIVASLLLTDDLYKQRGTASPTSVYHLPSFDINVKPYMRLTQ